LVFLSSNQLFSRKSDQKLIQVFAKLYKAQVWPKLGLMVCQGENAEKWGKSVQKE
jgi:hypothetical protein